MRKALFSLAIFCFPLILNAQTHDSVPRLEAGLQLVFADLGPVDPVGGAGGRFHYNFNDHYALDTEITYHQQDVSPTSNFLAPAVTLGQTNVFAGLRADSASKMSAHSFVCVAALCTSTPPMARNCSAAEISPPWMSASPSNTTAVP